MGCPPGRPASPSQVCCEDSAAPPPRALRWEHEFKDLSCQLFASDPWAYLQAPGRLRQSWPEFSGGMLTLVSRTRGTAAAASLQGRATLRRRPPQSLMVSKRRLQSDQVPSDHYPPSAQTDTLTLTSHSPGSIFSDAGRIGRGCWDKKQQKYMLSSFQRPDAQRQFTGLSHGVSRASC